MVLLVTAIFVDKLGEKEFTFVQDSFESRESLVSKYANSKLKFAR